MIKSRQYHGGTDKLCVVSRYPVVLSGNYTRDNGDGEVDNKATSWSGYWIGQSSNMDRASVILYNQSIGIRYSADNMKRHGRAAHWSPKAHIQSCMRISRIPCIKSKSTNTVYIHHCSRINSSESTTICDSFVKTISSRQYHWITRKLCIVFPWSVVLSGDYDARTSNHNGPGVWLSIAASLSFNNDHVYSRGLFTYTTEMYYNAMVAKRHGRSAHCITVTFYLPEIWAEISSQGRVQNGVIALVGIGLWCAVVEMIAMPGNVASGIIYSRQYHRILGIYALVCLIGGIVGRIWFWYWSNCR